MKNHACGLSLLELLTSLTIFSLLIAITIPSMGSYLAKAESRAVTQELRRLLATARETAVMRSTVTTLCGLDDAMRCNSAHIRNVAIFEDRNENDILDADEKAFALHELKHSGELFLRASLRQTKIRFARDGSSKVAGSFIYCKAGNPLASARITVSMAGRAYTAIADDDGIVVDTDGQTIICAE